jgi:hypothetical protein
VVAVKAAAISAAQVQGHWSCTCTTAQFGTEAEHQAGSQGVVPVVVVRLVWVRLLCVIVVVEIVVLVVDVCVAVLKWHGQIAAFATENWSIQQ